MTASFFTPLIEIAAKMALQAFFSYMKSLEKTEMEIKVLFLKEKEEFFKRDSQQLKQIKEVNKLEP